MNNWDNRTIDHVEITVEKKWGSKGAGAILIKPVRCAYDPKPPAANSLHDCDVSAICLSADSIRDEKVKVLKSLRRTTAPTYAKKPYVGNILRASPGQKSAGISGRRGREQEQQYRTFVAIRVDIDNWRWAGVPFSCVLVNVCRPNVLKSWSISKT